MKKHLFKPLFIFILLLLTADISLAAKKNTKLNFQDVEISTVVKLMGKVTGRSFVFNNRILKGKRITCLSKQKFTPDEAYKIFELMLTINGLSLIDDGKVTRIVNAKEAKSTSVPLFKEGDKVNSGSFITRIIPVRHTQIRSVRANLAPLVSKNAILIANEDANVLILKDTRENTERFAEIVQIIDKTDNLVTALNLEIVPLVYANSGEMSSLLTRIFSTTVKKGAADRAKIKILAEKRTNSLILLGHPVSLGKIKELIIQLDTEIEIAEGNIRVYPLKNANAKKVAEVLQKIAGTFKTAKKQKGGAGKTTIIPDIPSNALVIYSDQANFSTLENVIMKLDIERAQVFIQALIMEVTLDKSLDLGVEWQGSEIQEGGKTDSLVTVGSIGATGTPRTLAAAASNSSSAGAVIGVLGGPITFGGTQYSTFSAFIRAVEQDSEIDILSNPQILTLNNEEAEIKVGEIIPTIGSSKTDANGNTTTSVNYKEVGVSLTITPQINLNDSIELKINETSSNVIVGKSDTLSQQGAITTLNRSLKTKVVVENGQTIVLGGMISEEITSEEARTPCLGDIPIVGWLFKRSGTRTRKTNLLVFLTPRVVRNKEELAVVTKGAKKRLQRSKKGNFRIDISKEFNLPLDEDAETDVEDQSEENPPEENEPEENPPEKVEIFDE